MSLINHGTDGTGDGGTAAIVAGLLVVILVVIGVIFFVGITAPSNVIDIDTPKLPTATALTGH